MLIYEADDFISKRLPAEAGVGMRLTSANRQDGIEQQNTLTRPAFKITMIGAGETGNEYFLALYTYSAVTVVSQCRGERKMPDHAPVLVRDKDPDRESPL